MSSRPVEWHVDAASSRLLRGVVYVAAGLFGGGALLVFGGMAFLGVSLALGGEYSYLAWIVLLALIGGPLSLLYLWPVLIENEQRPSLSVFTGDEGIAERYAAVFTRGRLLAAVLGGALSLLALSLLDPRLAFAAVVGSILLLPIASGVISRGRLDPREATMTYVDRPVELVRVEGVRRIDVGGIALCWLSYHPGHGGFGTPHLITATLEAADAVERVVADVDPGADEEYAPDRTVQGAFGFLALCFLGVAALVFVVEPGNASDPALRWYIAVGLGLFGALFAFAALVSG